MLSVIYKVNCFSEFWTCYNILYTYVEHLLVSHQNSNIQGPYSSASGTVCPSSSSSSPLCLCPLGPGHLLLPHAKLFILPLGTVCSFYLELPILFSVQVIPFHPSGQGSHLLSSQGISWPENNRIKSKKVQIGNISPMNFRRLEYIFPTWCLCFLCLTSMWRPCLWDGP